MKNQEKYLTKWGNDRGVDPFLLRLNTQVWDAVPDESGHAEASEILGFVASYMGESLGGSHSEHYATQAFQTVRKKYGCGGFTIEGIDPRSGERSGYPRFRGIDSFAYLDKGKQKQAKYLSGKGSKPCDFYARVPIHIAQKIAARYGLTYDRPASEFWKWVRDNRIPVYLAEGEGDALAVLSRGYVAIGIPGHNMALPDGAFRDSLLWLLEYKPEVMIGLDCDEKPSTIAAVEYSRQKVWFAFKKLGITATIGVWEPSQGKGLGDLSQADLDEVIRNAKPLGRKSYRGLTAGTVINQRFLDLPIVGNMALKSRYGTGKSYLFQNPIREWVREGRKVLGITHRISLGQACGDRWGLPWLKDDDLRRWGMVCIHSMKFDSQSRFSPSEWEGAIVVIDEILQVLRDLVNSDLLNADRCAILNNFKLVCQKASQIILLDADLDDKTIALFKSWGIEFDVTINEYQNPNPFPIVLHDDPGSMLALAVESIESGKKVLITSDTAKCKEKGEGKVSGKYSTIALEKELKTRFPDKKILRVDQDTLIDPSHPAYGCLRYDGNDRVRLAALALVYDLIIISPSLGTGIDLNIPGVFHESFNFIAWFPPQDAGQFLNRLRDDDCTRHLWIGNNPRRIGNGDTTRKGVLSGISNQLKASLTPLDLDSESMIDTSWLNFWAMAAADHNADCMDYRESVLDLFKSKGHTITIAGSVPAIDTSEAALTIAVESTAAIVDADQISDSEAMALDKKRELTRGERARLDRHKIERMYGIAISPDLVRLNNSVGYSPTRMGWLFSNPIAADIQDSALLERPLEVWLPTLAKRSAKGKVRALNALGIAEIIDRDEFCGDDLATLKDKCLTARKQVRAILGVSVTEKTPAVSLLRAILKTMGRSIALVRKEESKRFYRVEPVDPLTQQIHAAWDARMALEGGESISITPSAMNCIPLIQNNPQPSEGAKLALDNGESISITPSAMNCIPLIQIEADLTEEYAKTTPDLHKIEKLMQELDRLSLTIAA